MSEYIYIPNAATMEALGESLAVALGGSPLIIFLAGELGAGKTTLARGLLRALGHSGPVKSPTYALVEPYEGLVPPVYHLDLYRLTAPEELELMGIRDYFAEESICLVEWAERGEGGLPGADLLIGIKPVEGGRTVEVKARTERGRAVLAVLFPASSYNESFINNAL